jgi:hypothetical protein
MNEDRDDARAELPLSDIREERAKSAWADVAASRPLS